MEFIQIVRPYMEVLSFCSTAVLATAAVYALKQISILKSTLKIQSKRDALRLTSEQCGYYMDTIIQLQDALDEEIERQGITYYEGWEVEITEKSVRITRDRETSIEEFEKADDLKEHKVLNAMESFSSYFVSGVADEMVAYHTVGTTFIDSCDCLMPFILTAREDGYYKNTLSLYLIWANRKKADELKKQKKSIESELARTKESHINPVGTDFT